MHKKMYKIIKYTAKNEGHHSHFADSTQTRRCIVVCDTLMHTRAAPLDPKNVRVRSVLSTSIHHFVHLHFRSVPWFLAWFGMCAHVNQLLKMHNHEQGGKDQGGSTHLLPFLALVHVHWLQ